MEGSTKMKTRSYIRSCLAIALVGAVIALPILGIDAPGELTGMAAAAVGFYFAAEENGEIHRHHEKMEEL